MKNSLLLFTLASLCSTSYAQVSWQCTNKHVEISCNEQSCQVQTESFTPFNIKINNNQKVSICAYSGCWSGKVKHAYSKTFDQYFTLRLTWNNGEISDESFSIAIDKTEQIGSLLGSGFIIPLICEAE